MMQIYDFISKRSKPLCFGYKQGIIDTFIQTIGDIPPVDKEGYGQSAFSPQGDKMIRFYPHQAIWLYHFDRSTGFFTAFDTIHIDFGSFLAFDGGCAVSPNGRFLYITALTKAYQFDLLASDISSTQTTIATWDGFVDPIAISFWICQLGPDCKIYVIGGGDTRYYHIIHNPDEPGLACNFEQRGLVLPTPSGASIPYFPNYRLGSIDNPGVPCTATVSVNQPVAPIESKSLWVYPNPAMDEITIQYDLEDGEANSVAFFDLYGKMVFETLLPGKEGEILTKVNQLSNGVYFYALNGLVSGRIIINN